MENQTHQTTEKVEVVTTEAQAVVSPPPAEGETQGEQVDATVAVEPTAEKPVEQADSLVPAVLAVVAAVVALVAVVKKLLSK